MRLSKAVCAVVAETLSGSHKKLDALFVSAGVPGDPPDLPHDSKWKEWLYRAGQDPSVDILAVLGSLLEEFMDLTPQGDDHAGWSQKRARVEKVLEESGLRYYRLGRVLPTGEIPQTAPALSRTTPSAPSPAKPNKVEELLEVIVRGLRRAMHPLSHRRKGAQALSFVNEYDVQDLLHALLRPWI